MLLLLFSFTAAAVKCLVAKVKHLTVALHSDIHFFYIYNWAHSAGYFENRIPLTPMVLAFTALQTHHENIPIQFWLPLNPTFILLNCGLQGYTLYFLLISAQKHRLWVLVRTASAIIYILSRNMKKEFRIFIWKLSAFGGDIFNIFE